MAASLRSGRTVSVPAGAWSPLTARGVAAEAFGTALLLAAIVGSGVMGERLAAGNAAIALLANSLATGAALFALIVVFGEVSGAHFNPVVSLFAAVERRISWRSVPIRALAQFAGAALGVVVAHSMFELPLVMRSTRVRAGLGQGIGELVATFGLIGVVAAAGRHRDARGAVAVAAYITGAYWFTSSTSFANPAVTLARTLTDTFSGIRPADAPGFVLAQLLGGALATCVFRCLHAPDVDPRRSSDPVAIPGDPHA
jgi:glycerol uptake facilitator-like aquaporin